ncbi:MAG: ankyrin repeat domain-containing protein [Flavobacteriaceae bacterium]|nr:ankyrin repeat domain-containing protein [Flavobacteriaceae bacterium]
MKTVKIAILLLWCSVYSVHASTFSGKEIASKEMTNKVQVSSFCMAVIKGDVEMVKKMIALGEDVNKKSFGKTPLMFAARYNKAEVVKVLIHSGAKLHVLCDRGFTAKRYAELSNAKDALAVLESALNPL